MFQIEKNVGIPERRKPRPTVWPFTLMEVGDSVLVPAEKITAARTIVGQTTRRHNMRFLTRSVDGGLRVWRIE
jgi:hypothetical protein